MNRVGFIDNKIGAAVYNTFHHKGIAVVSYIAGSYLSRPLLQLVGIVLFSHSAMDRILGYGMKYNMRFKFTDLGGIGKQKK